MGTTQDHELDQLHLSSQRRPAREQQPTVSLWFAGMQRQVRYRAKAGGTEEDPLLIHLILDLEAL